MNLYRLIRPALFALPPEAGQKLALGVLRLWPAGRKTRYAPSLKSNVAGIDFPSPIGLAAGLDKNIRTPEALLSFGFGFLEMGALTPSPRQGLPRPRLWRRTRDEAIINRLGLPNDGIKAGAARLARFRAWEKARGLEPAIIGVNIAPQEAQAGAAAWRRDLVDGVQCFANHASYLAINLSSPNMAGLRDLQQANPLRTLLNDIAALDSPPVMLKLAPDLSESELTAIAETAQQAKLAALIMGNTTSGAGEPAGARQGVAVGGLSGKPLQSLARQKLAMLYQMTQGKIPLISVGGIDSGAEAFARILAGASLVQLYTGLIFHGPSLVRSMSDELATLLTEHGFATLAQAVGAKA